MRRRRLSLVTADTLLYAVATLAVACGGPESASPPPEKVEQFVDELEANAAAEKEAAVAAARAREQERLDAAAKRLEKADR